MMKNVHTTKCRRDGLRHKDHFQPPTVAYRERAAKVELTSHNTNIFNGRNLSDNTIASSFYQVKARPELGTVT